MTDQEDNISLGKIVVDDNKQERKSWACLFQIANCVSVPAFFILVIIFGCFWRIHLSKTCDEATV